EFEMPVGSFQPVGLVSNDHFLSLDFDAECRCPHRFRFRDTPRLAAGRLLRLLLLLRAHHAASFAEAVSSTFFGFGSRRTICASMSGRALKTRLNPFSSLCLKA